MPSREDDEYELIPMSPIRRLERRMEKLESTSSGLDVGSFFKELVAIIRMNQEIVDELAKSSDSLRIELSKLPAKLDQVTSGLNELLTYIKVAAVEETAKSAPEDVKLLSDKLDQLVEINKRLAESNENLTALMESMDKKMKPLPPRPPILRPMVR
ncbi:MAG: hypothetical protein HYW22_01535 [Candidatus Aenigmarchaeota archaeon]|nr:hypothetical protein [Candidatus Aenigmarchaeota archaeon]